MTCSIDKQLDALCLLGGGSQWLWYDDILIGININRAWEIVKGPRNRRQNLLDRGRSGASEKEIVEELQLRSLCPGTIQVRIQAHVIVKVEKHAAATIIGR